jgi:hypothetical protein
VSVHLASATRFLGTHEESIHPGEARFGRSLGVGTTWRLLEARAFLLGADEVNGVAMMRGACDRTREG